ncbi:hypothetical protein, partial [Larkinella sp. C7]
ESDDNDNKAEEVKHVDNLEVKLLSNQQMTQNEKIEFEISYDVLDDTETHIVFSLTDIDRNIWIYNDNALDYPTQGSG